MKVGELSGVALDYWVARANGAGSDVSKLKSGESWCAIETVPNAIKPFPACVLGHKVGRGKHPSRNRWFYPSTVWNDGGPILARERIDLLAAAGDADSWFAQTVSRDVVISYFGPTILVAAMRVFVAKRFGPEVPDEVLA
ncbi:DUF2591 domain-containing protein [Burkholderia glumae]|uniref:phage protein NinX family protein n=1 Tax=Burkholderia glumae TaxID=337 RepID=UPI00203752DB|nr:phage protein NinX family protein [Burkholderia glumae]MCM2537697.1 DUF2591 domain-containing protein [Burkholderia glumae]